MAKDMKCSVAELITNKELRSKINVSAYVTPTVGMPTLQDIMQSLKSRDVIHARRSKLLTG